MRTEKFYENNTHAIRHSDHQAIVIVLPPGLAAEWVSLAQLQAALNLFDTLDDLIDADLLTDTFRSNLQFVSLDAQQFRLKMR